MSRIIITEEQKHNIDLLLEDKEGKNLAKARHYIVANGYSSEQARQMVDSIRTDIPNSRLQQCKFILGVARLYLDGQLSDGQSIAALNKALKYIASDAHVNEYDNNLNNESLQVLVDRFKGVAKDDLQQSMDKSNSRQLTVNQDYTIVPIDNAEEAAKYGKYTSWCVTHQSNMYDSYTNNGTGRFYFCLRNGFEKEPKVEGEGCPLDRYGLSMIAVSVTMEGEVNTITCRWNHDMGGNDNIMTIEHLEDLLGRNFYQTFKPYAREELHAKGIILFDEVQGLLDSGKKPETVFDYVDNFSDGFAKVELNNKYNFINREGRLLSNQWFDDAYSFRYGFAGIKLNDKWNFINREYRLLSNQWFDDVVGDVSDGFAKVYLNHKYNFINREGRLLSNQWFDAAGDFSEGFAKVYLNHKWNFINIEGQFLSNQWFDWVYGFSEGFAIVNLNDKYNFINREGQLLSNQWFDWVYDFSEGFAIVKLNNKWNFINKEGQSLSNQWFDYAGGFIDGVASVKLNKKWYKINQKGEIVESKNRNKKTIIITEEKLKLLNESVLMDTLPDDIVNAVMRKKTSLGNNPALPNIFDEGFLEKIVNKGFNSAKEALVDIGSIDDVEETEPSAVLNRLILNAQKREEKIRPQLEKICYNYITTSFNVPDTDVELIMSLREKIDTSMSSIILDPIDGDDEFEFADIVDAESIKSEVYKRRLLDVLIMGASLKLTSNIKDYVSDIYELDPILPDLYRKILALNQYLLYTKEDLNLTEKDMKQLGTVEVTIGNDIRKNRIESQGVVFPILLSETLRGFMELFISHGLPDDLDRAKQIIGKSDFLKNEPWDMRLGPSLWEIFSDTFEDLDTTTLPYVLYIIAKLPVNKFNKLFKNIFAKTRLGKSVMKKIINKAKEQQNEIESDALTMSTDRNLKTILSDEIDSEEL